MKISDNNNSKNLYLNLNNPEDNSIQMKVIDTYPGVSTNEKEAFNPNDFRGKIEDYKFLKEIGKGSYASVKSAIHKSTGNKYAIKIYEKYKLMDPAKKSAVKREIQILRKIEHKNIVGLIEVIDNPKQVI